MRVKYIVYLLSLSITYLYKLRIEQLYGVLFNIPFNDLYIHPVLFLTLIISAIYLFILFTRVTITMCCLFFVIFIVLLNIIVIFDGGSRN